MLNYFLHYLFEMTALNFQIEPFCFLRVMTNSLAHPKFIEFYELSRNSNLIEFD